MTAKSKLRMFLQIIASAFSWGLSWALSSKLSLGLVFAFQFFGGSLGWSVGAHIGRNLATGICLAVGGMVGGTLQLWILKPQLKKMIRSDTLITLIGWGLLGGAVGILGWTFPAIAVATLVWCYSSKSKTSLTFVVLLFLGWLIPYPARPVYSWGIGWWFAGAFQWIVLQRILPSFSERYLPLSRLSWAFAGSFGWIFQKNSQSFLGWTPSWFLGGLLGGWIGSTILLLILEDQTAHDGSETGSPLSQG